MNELRWIAIPSGRTSQSPEHELSIATLIVPKLTVASLHEAGMSNWPPQQLTGQTVEVLIADSEKRVLNTATVLPDFSRLKTGFWHSIFGGGVPVVPRTATPATSGLDRRVSVDETTKRLAKLQQAFQRAARGPTSRQQFATTVQEVLNQWTDETFLAEPALLGSGRGGRENPVRQTARRELKDPPKDFHRIVSMLQEQPAVLYALGLIFDLKLPANALRPGACLLKVNWSGSSLVPRVVSPWSSFDTNFRPGPSDSIVGGMVKLDEALDGWPRWMLAAIDVDMGSARLSDAAHAAQAARARGEETENAAMPTFRTAGLMLLKKERWRDFESRRDAGWRNFNTPAFEDIVLDADDLMLGYRIDIERDGEEWLSLHERSASYVTRRDGVTIEMSSMDEGHLRPLGAVDYGDPQSVDADEIVTRWDGWNLSVPRPIFGRRARSAATHNPSLPYVLTWEFRPVPRSLPKLRFGSLYRMSARVADRVGGGLKRQAVPEAARMPTTSYLHLRYEPVSPPSVVHPPGTGQNGSELVIVLRSDIDLTPEQFLRANPSYWDTSPRHILPPRAAFGLAEQHGALDAVTDQKAWETAKRAITDAAQSDAELFPDFAALGVCILDADGPGTPQIYPTTWAGTWPDLSPKRIEVVEGREFAIKWVEDEQVLRITLNKGAQRSFEISSPPRAPEHFAVANVALSTEAAQTLRFGRHPMVSPATRLTVIHAIRRPLRPPGGWLLSRRNKGDTFAIIEHSDPMLGLDAASTAQLDVEAQWDDPISALPRPFEPVLSLPIERKSEAIRQEIRHNFGDTKHRKVTYRITAVSRFRDLFFDSDPHPFVSQVTFPKVYILNSVQPPAVQINSIVPAFKWETSFGPDNGIFRKHRRGGGLRLEIDGNWFQTGEDERLAVIVASNTDVPSEVADLLSQAARDPIAETSNPVRWLRRSDFSDAAGAIEERVLPNANAKVWAVPFAPWERDGRWFADLAIEGAAASSHWPFVRLAVARYQPNSLPGLELSPATKLEMVQLLPSRTLTMQILGREVRVELEGAEFPTNVVDVVLETCELPVGTQPESIELTALNLTDANLDQIPAWRAVPNESKRVRLNEMARLRIPPGGGLFRFRIRELEVIPGNQPQGSSELYDRVVFADAIVIPSFFLS